MHLIKKTLIVLILFTTTASGQTPKIDSLEALLKKHIQADTAKVNLLNTLAYELFTRDPQKAKLYSHESWDISSQLDYPKGKAASLWTTGLLLLKSDKKESLDYFRKALKIAEEIDDKVGICNYQTAIGNITKELGDIKASNEAQEQALQAALATNDKRLILKTRINIARNQSSSGAPVEAAQQLQEAIKIAEELDDQPLLARAYGTLGSIYRLQGNSPTALEYYLLALQLNEKNNEYSSTSINLINIAGIQSEQSEFDAALETINKALQLASEKRDSMKMSICFTNFGNIYQQMNRPEALDYFQKALTMSKDSNIGQNINNLMNIGSIYAARNEFDAAMKNFGEALALAQKADIKSALGEVYVKIGVSYLQQKQYNQAKDYIQKALALATTIHYTELQKDCHRLLSEIYAATGNFRDAYTSHVQYKLLFDGMFNEKNTRKIALLESSHKFAKEREVYELEKSGRELRIKNQQQTILSLVVISLLVLLLSFAVYWSGRLKKRVLKLEIENINRELEANQKAMAVAKLKLVQNSERDAHTVQMLEDIGKCAIGVENKNINSLINNYKFQSNHSNWEEFETLFTKVNTSFWDKLNELYPTLTPNERKLCVFLKLNMSNKDIALITLQSEEALKKSRLRLRKKFDLDRSINLSAFIQNL